MTIVERTAEHIAKHGKPPHPVQVQAWVIQQEQKER